VINCGGESRLSQPEDVYRLRSHALSLALGKEVARRGIRAFVECSTAAVYKSDRKPRKEGDKTSPPYDLAKWKLTTEVELQKISGLNLVILRFAHVYGDYDTGFLTAPICLSRVYKDLERPLPFLHPKDQSTNTVHVKDAVRALWRAAEWRASQSIKPSSSPVPVIFNIVDHNKTTKGDFANAISKVFGIECTFMNSLMAQIAKLRNMEDIFDEVNEEALEVWADLLNDKGITRPGPITPFFERDYLLDGDLSVNGSLFEETTGFDYEFKTVPPDWVESLVNSYQRMNWWP
jgi:nucleoside-diphosphate-sugar epimerase